MTSTPVTLHRGIFSMLSRERCCERQVTRGCETPMLKSSESVVLRTYPMHESDLLVTLFTRNEGKVKGVAKAAKKSKRRFGGALEPLTIVCAHYEHKY